MRAAPRVSVLVQRSVLVARRASACVQRLSVWVGVVKKTRWAGAKRVARDGVEDGGEGGCAMRVAAQAKKGLRPSWGGRLARSYWAESLKRSVSVGALARGEDTAPLAPTTKGASPHPTG